MVTTSHKKVAEIDALFIFPFRLGEAKTRLPTHQMTNMTPRLWASGQTFLDSAPRLSVILNIYSRNTTSTVCFSADFLKSEEWTFHTSWDSINRVDMHIVWNLHKVRILCKDLRMTLHTKWHPLTFKARVMLSPGHGSLQCATHDPTGWHSALSNLSSYNLISALMQGHAQKITGVARLEASCCREVLIVFAESFNGCSEERGGGVRGRWFILTLKFETHQRSWKEQFIRCIPKTRRTASPALCLRSALGLRWTVARNHAAWQLAVRPPR